MKLSTSGPALDLGTVKVKDSGDLVIVAVAEALNLAASHLQSRVTADQAAFAVAAFTAAVLDWAACETGASPLKAAHLAVSMLPPGLSNACRVPWQEPVAPKA